MKSKKMSDAAKEDFSDASFKGKKKHKLTPVKKQKSNRNQFFDELDEFDEEPVFDEDDIEEFIEEDFDLDVDEESDVDY
jgi:hypothetical protein